MFASILFISFHATILHPWSKTFWASIPAIHFLDPSPPPRLSKRIKIHRMWGTKRMKANRASDECRLVAGSWHFAREDVWSTIFFFASWTPVQNMVKRRVLGAKRCATCCCCYTWNSPTLQQVPTHRKRPPHAQIFCSLIKKIGRIEAPGILLFDHWQPGEPDRCFFFTPSVLT